MIIFILQRGLLVQLFSSLSYDLFLPAYAEFLQVLQTETELTVDILREESSCAHVILRSIVVPKQFVVLRLDWHLLNVVGLLQVFHLSAPTNLPQDMLVVI